MLSRLSAEDPYAVVIAVDFNCRSSKWWQGDTDNEEGKGFELFSIGLGLHQLIAAPTHIMGDSKPCIGVIFTDQPNFLQSSVHPSLQDQCHHQIVYGELCIQSFNWFEHMGHPTSPNQQVEILTETLLNICSYFIINKIITVRLR